MMDFAVKKSAGCLREVFCGKCEHPARNVLIPLREVKLREVFAGSVREVREVGSQAIDIAAGSLRAGSP